jgi:pSer/pThr/pTyr-binding forkhead associated (FHA) protein
MDSKDSQDLSTYETVILKITNPRSDNKTWGETISKGQKVKVGRRSHNDIVIIHPSVSREHLVFHWTESGLLLKDLTSKNGTKLNQKTIQDEAILKLGDSIELSDVTIRLISPDAIEAKNLIFSIKHNTDISFHQSLNMRKIETKQNPFISWDNKNIVYILIGLFAGLILFWYALKIST